MYLTTTHPNMMYVVCLISHYMANPKEEHMQNAKRGLRYLRGALNFGLFYRRRTASKLLAYTDSDYERDVYDIKSTSGYVFLLSETTVCWSSKKKAIITLSSTETEYVVATSCACHCVWENDVLEKIEDENYECIDILCDNSSSIKLSKNHVMHRRTKYIDVRSHYLRDLSNQALVKLVFCGTREQITDIIITPLKLDQFVKLRRLLGVGVCMVQNHNQIEPNIWISLVFKTTLIKPIYILKIGLCLDRFG